MIVLYRFPLICNEVEKKKYDHEGTRTLSLLIRSQTPYPLGHAASRFVEPLLMILIKTYTGFKYRKFMFQLLENFCSFDNTKLIYREIFSMQKLKKKANNDD